MSKIQIYQYKKYLLDNPITEKIYLKYLTENKGNITLINAPTGSGKTKTFFNMAKKLPDDYLVFGIFPNRIQSTQNQKDYSVESITSGDTLFREGHITKDRIGKRIYSLVYDKAVEICELFETEMYLNIIKNYHVCFVFDECHEIINSSSFRSEAMDYINKAIAHIVRAKGNILHISATTFFIEEDSNYDNIIHFEKEDYHSNVGSIILKSNEDGHRFDDFIVGEVQHEIETTKNTVFARYNSIKKTAIIKDRLKEKGLVIETLDATNKGYDKTKGQFENKHYGSIIENSFLDTASFNAMFTTSIMDEGTSIKKVSKDKITLFIIFERDYSIEIDKIIQFLNRFRFDIEKCIILINTNKKPSTAFHSFAELRKKEKDIFVKRGSLYEKSYKELLKDNFPFSMALNFMDIRYENENKYNAFTLDENKNINLNQNIYKFIAYKKYNKQFFYNREELKNQLKGILKNNVLIDDTNYYDEKEKKTYKENREEEKELFLKAVESAKCLLESKDTSYLKKLNASEKNELELLLKNKAKVNPKEIHDNYKNLKAIIEAKDVFKFMKIGIDYVNTKTLLKHLAKAETKTEFKEYILSFQFKLKNGCYIADKNSPTVKLSYAQQALLEKYCKFDNGTFITKELSDQDYYNLKQELEISQKEIKKLFKTIFICDSHHSNLRILGIKILQEKE